MRPIFLHITHRVNQIRLFTTQTTKFEDVRLKRLGNIIKGEFGTLREKYKAPKNAIVLAHGLFGFDEFRLAGKYLPGIQYWRGIREALIKNGVEVIVAEVPPSGSIEARAEKLADLIRTKASGKSVNIIAHSMGGLDSRYMISQLKPKEVQVKSLTTIATPHRGSAFADYMFDRIGSKRIPKIYKALEYVGLETGAFTQLTREYMAKSFNPRTPDIEGIRYFSYGAILEPTFWSIFRFSHGVIRKLEKAENDGLVSVASSQWGEYKGTLMGVSHLDLINWTNRMKWWIYDLTGKPHDFNGIAFYLHIADMLADEDL